MSNSFFRFKQFIVNQDQCAMKVTTDACLFGAWVSKQINNEALDISNSLDIGTGTGLLPLMVAQETNFLIDSIEIDKNSFEQANQNIGESPFAERINLFYNDVREFRFPHKYDLIFSNPPFYENELQSDDPRKNVALHSDMLSLDELFKVISANLSHEGMFFLLLPYKRIDDIKPLLKEYDLDMLQIIFVKHSVDHDNSRIMLKGKIKNKKKADIYFKTIAIWDERKQHTEEFKELMRDYYLYL